MLSVGEKIKEFQRSYLESISITPAYRIPRTFYDYQNKVKRERVRPPKRWKDQLVPTRKIMQLTWL